MLIRHVQRAGLILGAIFAAVLFFLGGAALRLLMGPISLGPFAGIIEDAINHSVPGVVVRFDQAVLEWSRAEGKVNLIVLGTKVFDSNGHIIAQAPKADLDFDAAAIVQGHLNVRRLGLIGVQITGVRAKDGTIRLGFGPEQDNADLLKTLRDILKDSAAGGGTLDSLSIQNARLAFRDEPTGLFIIAPEANFTLHNKGAAMDASLDSAVEIAGAPGRITANAVLRSDGSPDHGTIAVKGLSLPALVRSSENFAVLKPYRLVSDVQGNFVLDAAGKLQTTTFQVSGQGSIDNDIFKPALKLNNFAVTGSYDVASNAVALDDFKFDSKEISAKGKANLALAWQDEALGMVTGNLETSELRVDAGWFPQPLRVSRLAFEGGYDLKARVLSWQRAAIDADPLSSELTGTVQFSGKASPAFAVNGTVKPLSLADVLRYWPPDVGIGAREWIVANVSQGQFGPLQVEANFPAGTLDRMPLPDSVLTLSFPFENVTARYIEGMTPLTEARGEARLTGDAFHVVVAAASVGPLPVSQGDVTIPDLHTEGVVSRIKAHTEGRMLDILNLINEEPLGYPKRFGINPTTVAGRAAVDLDFELPLLRDLTFDQVKMAVQAKATDLAMPIDNRKLEHATMSFAIDNKSLTSQGTGTLSTVPITFKWTEDFAAPAVTTRVDVAGRLDDAARATLGWSEPKFLTGPMPVTLALSGRRFHFSDAALSADTTNAVLEIPTLNLFKRAGARSNATAQLQFGEGGAVTFNDLVITGEGLNAKGVVAIDGAGHFLSASFSDLRAGINDFAMNVEPLPGNGMTVRIQGKSLDATHFFADKTDKDKKAAPNAPPAPDTDSELQNPLTLNLKVDRLVFHENVGFKNVTLAVSYAAKEKLTGFNLDAIGTGKGKVTGHMDIVKGVRNLALETDDAGAFLDSFMNFSSVRGGKLAAKINFPIDTAGPAAPKTPPADYQGTLTLSDITVTNQPFIARLFSAGSLDGPLRLLQGQGIQLTTVSIPFNARAKLVTIHEGRAAGPAIGATFEGMLDRKADKIDVTGTLVPVYGLNSFLGAVPILGDILVSKKGEGIFGLTYAMKGNLSEPNVSVNPLSVLTPGIFRRIFEFDPPKMPPPEAQEPKPPQAAQAGPAAKPE